MPFLDGCCPSLRPPRSAGRHTNLLATSLRFLSNLMQFRVEGTAAPELASLGCPRPSAPTSRHCRVAYASCLWPSHAAANPRRHGINACRSRAVFTVHSCPPTQVKYIRMNGKIHSPFSALQHHPGECSSSMLTTAGQAPQSRLRALKFHLSLIMCSVMSSGQ
jgi:hypothetical protein